MTDDATLDAHLPVFFGLIGTHLRNATQRALFAEYTFGLLSDAERKSLEPLAARAHPEAPESAHHSLRYFLARAAWDDRAVRRTAAAWALMGATAGSPVRCTIIDDTGLLKQGTHSPGVARQYTGSAGKITNCQVAVTLAVATDHDTVPIDIDLYLPAAWADDATRRDAARIPTDLPFRTKAEIALAQLRAAHADGVPLGDLVLADADYGRSAAFRDGITELGLAYAVSVPASQHVWDAAGVWVAPMTAAAYAGNLSGRSLRRLTWRTGRSGQKLSARFAFLRVFVTAEGREPDRSRDRTQWLVIEWRDGEPAPGRFYLSTLPARLSKRALVRRLKERWRTERMYEDLKGELGFDHFEGRSWPGWQHHMSVVLSAYALLVGQRCARFSPGASRGVRADALRRAA